MKLKVKITYKDEKSEVFDCVDFPGFTQEWIVIFLENFVRKNIAIERVAEVETYFSND